jgi:hypothetical protein
MFDLRNDHLHVSLLDPLADRERFGTRYCTGGYIFQISDHTAGDLLSGPTYPESFNVYDGQGIPDSFNRAPLRDIDDPFRALVIGVGQCDLKSDQVMEFCDWTVEANGSSIAFRTSQELASYALNLTRTVSLKDRTVRSETRIDNVGAVGFQISWFPHPFFPQPDGDELCRLNIRVGVRDNDGYAMRSNGFISRRDWPWDTDHYLALDHDAFEPLEIIQRHSALENTIRGRFSYAPRFFPIWGNLNTFSWEPYFENSIAPGQTMEWWMSYEF